MPSRAGALGAQGAITQPCRWAGDACLSTSLNAYLRTYYVPAPGTWGKNYFGLGSGTVCLPPHQQTQHEAHLKQWRRPGSNSWCAFISPTRKAEVPPPCPYTCSRDFYIRHTNLLFMDKLLDSLTLYNHPPILHELKIAPVSPPQARPKVTRASVFVQREVSGPEGHVACALLTAPGNRPPVSTEVASRWWSVTWSGDREGEGHTGRCCSQRGCCGGHRRP